MSDTLSSLTPRQAEVLSLIAEGSGNKSISKKLGISDSATDAHVTNILERLSVNNRTKAAALYFKAQLTQANTRIEELEKQKITAKRVFEFNDMLANENEAQQTKIEEQQAKIDSLMLEYCPNEMTKEQMDNWESHQVKSDLILDEEIKDNE